MFNVFIALGIGLALGGVMGWLLAARRSRMSVEHMTRFWPSAGIFATVHP